MADSIFPELLLSGFAQFLHCTVNHVTKSVTNRETGGWNSLSRYNSSSRRLIALPQLAGRRAQAAAVSHIPVLTAGSITYFMLSGGGGDALEEELSDSWNSDCLHVQVFSPLVFLPKWTLRKKQRVLLLLLLLSSAALMTPDWSSLVSANQMWPLILQRITRSLLVWRPAGGDTSVSQAAPPPFDRVKDAGLKFTWNPLLKREKLWINGHKNKFFSPFPDVKIKCGCYQNSDSQLGVLSFFCFSFGQCLTYFTSCKYSWGIKMHTKVSCFGLLEN